MTLQVLDGPTIPAGESLSDGIDCSAGQIVRITVPQEYTEGNLTFQVSSNGDLYNDLYDDDGDEITITANPDSTIVIAKPWVRSVGWLKLRSGSRDHAVKQREDCKFAIAIDVEGSVSTRAGQAPKR
jgi:hypothetical protein